MLGGWVCSKRNPLLALNAPLCDNSPRWVLKRKVAPCKTQCSCPLSWIEEGGFSHLKPQMPGHTCSKPRHSYEMIVHSETYYAMGVTATGPERA